DSALYGTVYRLLRSPIFEMDDAAAKDMMRLCLTEPSEGLHQSYATHQEAMMAYRAYIDPLDYVWHSNKAMSIMSEASVERYLATQRQTWPQFLRTFEE
ncbi:MAG: P-aminobenzoate N-oxygenase AurF, partial [Cyanobacteria bacterium J06648_10]